MILNYTNIFKITNQITINNQTIINSIIYSFSIPILNFNKSFPTHNILNTIYNCLRPIKENISFGDELYDVIVDGKIWVCV